jgi:hypothetical protein
MPNRRYPRNAPGDFYVVADSCIDCRAPYHEAEDLMEHDWEADYPHCYFRKQPETPEEIERAISACNISCIKAVRYAGDDPAILQRMRQVGAEGSCDALGDTPRLPPRPQS